MARLNRFTRLGQLAASRARSSAAAAAAAPAPGPPTPTATTDTSAAAHGYPRVAGGEAVAGAVAGQPPVYGSTVLRYAATQQDQFHLKAPAGAPGEGPDRGQLVQGPGQVQRLMTPDTLPNPFITPVVPVDEEAVQAGGTGGPPAPGEIPSRQHCLCMHCTTHASCPQPFVMRWLFVLRYQKSSYNLACVLFPSLLTPQSTLSISVYFVLLP